MADIPGRNICPPVGPWARYEQILSTGGSSGTLIDTKEFRDGLGAKVVDNATTVNLVGSRVDDNGTLRITGGTAQANYDLATQNDFFQIVHGLWDQTHFKSYGSVVTESGVTSPSSNDGVAGATWGFVGLTWTGGPGNDFSFEYPYTIDLGTDYITITGLPSTDKGTTTHGVERLKFINKGGTFPTAQDPGAVAFLEDTRYFAYNALTTEGEMQIRRTTSSGTVFDFTDAGDANGRWIGTPYGEEVIIEELLGNVTFSTAAFIFHIRGDYDQDTLCEVRYRRTGKTTWKRAPDARAGRAAEEYELQQYHISGNIFRLAANTEYDVQFTISNPHGVFLGDSNEGTSTVVETTFRTRSRQRIPSGGTTHTPTTVQEIRELLGCTGAGGIPASAGDTIVIPVGDFSDAAGTNLLSGISVAGTEVAPIYVVGAGGGESILPRLNHADGASWIIYDSLRFNNHQSKFASANFYTINFSENSDGLQFYNCVIKFPDELSLDVHAAMDSGKWYDNHGGFFIGNNSGAVSRWHVIEDTLIKLGYYPDDPGSGSLEGWLPYEGFDARTESTVMGFNEFHNTYDNSFAHTSGSGGGNIVRHNELHHCDFYACRDDLWEFDHSDGGHMMHHNTSHHGANWGNTNLTGNTSVVHDWEFNAAEKTYDNWSQSDDGPTVDGRPQWRLLWVGEVSNDTSAGHSVRQQRTNAYTISGNTITLSATPAGGAPQNDDTVTFQSENGGAVPSGLSVAVFETYNNSSNDNAIRTNSATTYYVINASGNSFEVSATQGGGAITLTDDAGAAGRYCTLRGEWNIWAVYVGVSGANEKLSAILSDVMNVNFPTRVEYPATPPVDEFSIFYLTSRRTGFTGYRVASAQGETGSIPIWLFNNQHTGFPLVGAPDSPYKWKDAGATLNIAGTIVGNQYNCDHMDELNRNGAEYYTSNIWLKDSSGWAANQLQAIGDGPTGGTTGSPVLVGYLYWDRNAWFNQDVSKALLGQGTVPNMFTAYGIDENGLEILEPVSSDLDPMYDITEVPVKSPRPSLHASSDIGQREPMFATDTGQLYDAGPSEADMPGIDNVLGPYLNNSDTSNVSFLATKTNNRRDIGPHQAGLGGNPAARRTIVDYLSFYMPAGWEVKTPGTDYSSIGVTAGSGTARVLIGKTDDTAAVLIEYEEV